MNNLNPLFAGICNDALSIARGVDSQDARHLDRLDREAEAVDDEEDALMLAAQPHEEALAHLYGCDPVDIWEACAALRAARIARKD